MSQSLRGKKAKARDTQLNGGASDLWAEKMNGRHVRMWMCFSILWKLDGLPV